MAIATYQRIPIVKPSVARLNTAIPRANALGGYWPLGETAISTAPSATADAFCIKDLSGNQNHLAIGNGTVFLKPGQYGQAFWYQSNNFLAVSSANRASLNRTAFTVEAWVFLEANEGASGAGIFSCWGTNTGWIFGIWPTTNPVQFFFNATSLTSSATVALNTWTHLVGVYDGANASIYINGKLDTGPTARTLTLNTSATFNVSRYNADNTTFVPGRLDLLAYYQRALTQAEILESYRFPLAILAPARPLFAVPAVVGGGSLLINPGMAGDIRPELTGGIHG